MRKKYIGFLVLTAVVAVTVCAFASVLVHRFLHWID